MQNGHDDPVLSALCATLDRYSWRGFTPRLLARFVLAHWDRHAVERLLTGVPGGCPGDWGAIEPVPNDDPRAAALEAFLSARSWKHLSTATVGRQLLAVLWHAGA